MHPATKQLMEYDDHVRDAMTAAARAYAGVISGGKKTGQTRDQIVKSHFEQGNTARYKWKPLTPEYRAQKAKRFPGRPQNVLTGRLKSATLTLAAITPIKQGALIRFNLPDYAKYLVMQNRHPVKPDAEDKAEMMRVAERYLSSIIAAQNAISGPKIRGRIMIGK